MLVRLKEQHRDVWIDLSNHVEQHSAFRSEAGDHRELACKIVLEQALQHFTCFRTAVHAVQANRIALAEARGGVDPVTDPDGVLFSHKAQDRGASPRWARAHLRSPG